MVNCEIYKNSLKLNSNDTSLVTCHSNNTTNSYIQISVQPKVVCHDNSVDFSIILNIILSQKLQFLIICMELLSLNDRFFELQRPCTQCAREQSYIQKDVSSQATATIRDRQSRIASAVIHAPESVYITTSPGSFRFPQARKLNNMQCLQFRTGSAHSRISCGNSFTKRPALQITVAQLFTKQASVSCISYSNHLSSHNS